MISTHPIAILLALAIGYYLGRRHAVKRRTSREQKRRDWLALKITDLRVELEVRNYFIRDLLEEREALLGEAQSKETETLWN